MGIPEKTDKLTTSVFSWTLKSDQDSQLKYRGYPTPGDKRKHNLSLKTGIRLVDHTNKDYTLEPLLNQYRYLIGGKGSFLYKKLQFANMKWYGGLTKGDRLKAQLKFFESYSEYSEDFTDRQIIEYLMDKQYPPYLIKILNNFKGKAGDQGMGLKGFVVENEDYFSEVAPHFKLEDRADILCLGDALKEIRELNKSHLREWVVKANIYNGIFEMVSLVVVFGKTIIPQIVDGFEASISEFSYPIRLMDTWSNFLVRKWYLAITTVLIGWRIMKSKSMSILQGFIAFKLPFAKDYVVNNQLSRFFNVYQNVMEVKAPRDTFQQATSMVSNKYFKFILETYLDGTERDIYNSSKSLPTIMNEIPYVPKEYVDILVEAEYQGDLAEGINKVVAIVEPRVEEQSKQLNKVLFWGVTVFTILVFFVMTVFLFKDFGDIMERHDTQFIDSLRN